MWTRRAAYTKRPLQAAKRSSINRPRRFGESLLLSTMQAYFEKRRELFDGLEISGLETDWKARPVLHLGLSMVKEHTSMNYKNS